VLAAIGGTYLLELGKNVFSQLKLLLKFVDELTRIVEIISVFSKNVCVAFFLLLDLNSTHDTMGNKNCTRAIYFSLFFAAKLW
jgi:hypothetical protein